MIKYLIKVHVLMFCDFIFKVTNILFSLKPNYVNKAVLFHKI